MKTTLFLLCLLSTSVFAQDAQTFDQTFTVKVTNTGVNMMSSSVTFNGQTLEEVQKRRAKGFTATNKLVDRISNKGGNYQVTLSETDVSSSGTTTSTTPVTYEGVTLGGVTAVMRTLIKLNSDEVAEVEGRAAKGKKIPWGKNKD